MKLRYLLILGFVLSFQLSGISGSIYAPDYLTDTIPPYPPPRPDSLIGTSSACVGDNGTYYIAAMVGVYCQWLVDGTLQTTTDNIFNYTWTVAGLHTVAVYFTDNSGWLSGLFSMDVEVSGVPNQPGTIMGDNTVCENTYHTYTTSIGPFEWCQWKVNGMIQSSTTPTMTYLFGGAGNYLIEVTAYSDCGVSSPRNLEVLAQGTAPAPPGPIQGPEESCPANSETYTTTVAPGLDCAWYIDGVLQASTTTTMQVTWGDPGDYDIEVRAVSDCGTGNPSSLGVTVYYFPDVNLGNDTTLMEGQSLVLDAGNPGCSYIWSNGANTQTITVNQSGNYWVEASNFCGDSRDTIQVSVITGISSYSENFKGKIYFDGSRIHIDPAGTQIQIKRMKLTDISGRILYQGAFKDNFIPEGKGLLILILETDQKVYYKKILVY